MKKNNWVISFLLFGSLLSVGSASAISIDFSPESETVYIGDSFGVDVVISDLYATDTSREIVSAFDLDVIYDASVLTATGVTFGSSLGLNPSTDPFDFFSDAWITEVLTPGRLDFAESSWLSNSDLLDLQPNDSFVLATLNFVSIAEGFSSLIFDPVGYPGIDIKGYDPFSPFDMSQSTGAGQVSVLRSTQVPVPATLFLLIVGLFGLVSCNRFKRI